MTTYLPEIKTKKWTEDDVVCDVIGERTFQAAANWFNEGLPEKYQITRQSVHNWCVGRNAVDHEFLNALVLFYQDDDDERRKMAIQLQEMRQAKMRSAHVVGKKSNKQRLARSKVQA